MLARNVVKAIDGTRYEIVPILINRPGGKGGFWRWKGSTALVRETPRVQISSITSFPPEIS